MTRFQPITNLWRFFACVTPVFLGLLILRGWQSLDRIPADPGYGWVLRASNQGFTSIATSDPYFRLHELAVAWIVSLFPIAIHALLLSVLSHLAWALGAAVVAWTILRMVNSWSTGILAGLLVVLAPHAAESVLGNHGNVRWILLIVLVTVVSTPPEFRHGRFGVALLALVNGLSNPIAGVCLLPLVARGVGKRHFHRNDTFVGGWLVVGVILQIVQAYVNDFLVGHSTKTTAPWDGMGAFWWSGLLAPIAAAAASLMLLTFCKGTSGVNREFPTWLAILSLVIHGLSYLLGGIADRYFVTPMTLSLIALMLSLHALALRGQFLWRFAYLLLILLLTVPTLKWFWSSNYLASGPSWRSEVMRARLLCSSDNKRVLSLSLSHSSTQTLTCEDLF